MPRSRRAPPPLVRAPTIKCAFFALSAMWASVLRTRRAHACDSSAVLEVPVLHSAFCISSFQTMTTSTTPPTPTFFESLKLYVGFTDDSSKALRELQPFAQPAFGAIIDDF